MFRVFDTETNEWVNNNVYMNQSGELFLIKNSIFGKPKKFIMLTPDRYVFHPDIGLYDKGNSLVFLGDYVLAHITEGKDVVGFVAFANELSAYIILCEETNEFFTLGSEVTEFIEIIGNVFDGYVIDNYDELSLQESQT